MGRGSRGRVRGHRRRQRRRLSADHGRQAQEARLRGPEKGGMGLGHGSLMDRVRLGRLSLCLAEGFDPAIREAGHGTGSGGHREVVCRVGFH